MWAELAAFLKANTAETLVISLLGTLLVWMYKQFKAMIDHGQQTKQAAAQLKQGIFTKLELSIATVLHLKDEASKRLLYDLLGECGPHLTGMQRQVVRDYCKQFDPMLLHSLQALTVNEVDKLGRQLDKIRDDQEDSEWLHYIQRLFAPFGPIVIFILIALYLVFIFALMNQWSNLWVKIYISLLGASIFFSIVMTVSFLYFLAKRKLGKQGAKRWCMIVLLIASPALAFIVNRLEMFVVVIAVQIAAILFLSRSKRPSEIIRP